MSYGGCLTVFGAVCWQPTGLMGVVGPSLGLYVGNRQVLWGCWTVFRAVCWQPTGLLAGVDRLWGCMLATYKSYGGCWTVFASLGLYVGNLQVLWGCWTVFGAVCWQPTGLLAGVDRLWGCMLATYRSCGGCWTVFGAVCWQPTGLMGVAGPSLRQYIGNLQVLWGLLDRLWGCMLAAYRSYGALGFRV